MPDGHVCALMGLTWGWVGTYASDDSKLKQKVSKYFKAWINMARCHGSDSYVILPARDYPDTSYYRGNIRNHTTAAIALAYTYSSPKLRIQGHGKSDNKKPDFKKNEGERRTFYSSDRKRSFEERFISFDSSNNTIKVRKNNGRIVTVKVTDVSPQDQEYIEKFVTVEE